MRKTQTKSVIEIPRGIWGTAETKEEIEDWLLTQNPKLIRQLRRIKHEEDLTVRARH